MARRIGVMTATALLLAHGGYAMFRAADRVVIPVAASVPGLAGSYWHTDLEILNVDTVNIDVKIALLPNGNQDNSAWLHDAKQLGWDPSIFGYVVQGSPSLLTGIKPGQAVSLNDVISYWHPRPRRRIGRLVSATSVGMLADSGNEETNVTGALVVFAFQSGTYTTRDSSTATPARIVVTSRTYTNASTGGTFGEEVPGLPWPSAFDAQGTTSAPGLDHETFVDLRENEAYRSAIGLVNLSPDPITLDLTLTGADLTAIGSTTETLQPYAHVQFDHAVRTVFGVSDSDQITGATLTVALDPASVGQGNVPVFTAYCQRVDNATNAPEYVEGTYDAELPWNCVFNGQGCPTGTGVTTAPNALAMFRAASLQVVPDATSLAAQTNSSGQAVSYWQTDVTIRNVSSEAVDVMVVFLSRNTAGNYSWYLDIANALLPWSGQGSSHVNTALANIQQGQAVTLTNVVANGGTDSTDNGWNTGNKGALLVWAFKSGTKPPNATPEDVVVTSRIYTAAATAGATVQTYGQDVPALPWYDYLDPGKDAQGFNSVTFAGLSETASTTTGFANTFVALNLSDPLTTLAALPILDLGDGSAPRFPVYGIPVYPLSLVEYDDVASSLFGIETTTTPLVGGLLSTKVESISTEARVPVPAMMTYCTLIDNVTNDPIYLEQTWGVALPWDCAFDGANCPATQLSIHAQRAPLQRFWLLDPPRP